jgi:hypothetical protein
MKNSVKPRRHSKAANGDIMTEIFRSIDADEERQRREDEVTNFLFSLGREEDWRSEYQYYRHVRSFGLEPARVRRHYFNYWHGREGSPEKFYQWLEQLWEKTDNYLYTNPIKHKREITEADLCEEELDGCRDPRCEENHVAICATCGIAHGFPQNRRRWESRSTPAQRNALEMLRRIRSIQRILFVGKPIYSQDGRAAYWPDRFPDEDKTYWGGWVMAFDFKRLADVQTSQRFISHFICLLRAVFNMDFFGLQFFELAKHGGKFTPKHDRKHPLRAEIKRALESKDLRRAGRDLARELWQEFALLG